MSVKLDDLAATSKGMGGEKRAQNLMKTTTVRSAGGGCAAANGSIYQVEG